MLEQFKRNVTEIVTKRDVQTGEIAHKTLITNRYSQLDPEERFLARLWADGMLKNSVHTFEVSEARAWNQVCLQMKTKES